MGTRPIVAVVVGVGLFLILDALVPKTMAFKTLNADRYMTMSQRAHKRRNYMVQTANDQDIGSFENGFAYEVEPFGPERNPEELSAIIVDYANMIKGDAILLDKSMETRTSKRGNFKVKKMNQVIPEDVPCSCNYRVEIKTLGNDVFPRKVETRICDENTSCKKPFICNETLYDLMILNKRPYGTLPSATEENFTVHKTLMLHWYVDRIPISVGCTCVSDYVDNNVEKN